MPFLLLVGLLTLSFPAAAQYDAGGQNTINADIDVNQLDEAAKARIRVQGAVSGLGQAPTGASAGGSAPQKGTPGRVANEASSDREEARGARGSQPQEGGTKKAE